MDLPIPDCIDEIDSFDAYYSNVHIDQSSLFIPYINLGLSNHPLNPGDHLKSLDFAYMVFHGLSYVKVHKAILLGNRNPTSQIYYFGGINLDSSADLVDFEIACEVAYLHALATSRLSDSIWVPVESPMRNLDQAMVAAFFCGEMMPESIRQLVESRSAG
jgi:hypothetical protein